MDKINKLINHKYAMAFVTLFSFLAFMVTFLATKNIIPSGGLTSINYIKDTLYGLMVLCLLIASKDTFLAIFSILLYPFTIAQEFSVDATPISIIIPISLAIIGIIINIIRFKPKFKLGKYNIGFGIYGLGLALGGLFSHTAGDYKTYTFAWWHPFAIIGIVLLIMALFSYIVSTNERSFDDLVKLMLYLAILIMLEIALFVVTFDKSLSVYFGSDVKYLNLGWGIHNTVAMVLLMTLPFTLYKALENIKKYWYYLIFYVLIILAMVIAISKGGVLAALIGSIVAFFIFMFRSKNKKPFLIILCAGLGVILVSFVVLYLGFRSIYDAIMTHMTLENWNSRVVIYKSALNVFKENPGFGIGLFGGLGWKVENPTYQFAHQTFIQMMLISGTFGLICMAYHLVDKYSRVLYKPNNIKMIMFLSFLFPGIYGMIDVSYLNPSYLMVLIISMALFDKEIENDDIKYLF